MSQLTNNCRQVIALLILTAQDLQVALCLLIQNSCSKYVWKIRVFIKATKVPGFVFLSTLLPESIRQLNFFFFFFSPPVFLVPAWLGKCKSVKIEGFRECFPCFDCSSSGQLDKYSVCTASLVLGNVHLPCKVQDAITNTSCSKCQTCGFLCI